jgi:hypothetical protein
MLKIMFNLGKEKINTTNTEQSVYIISHNIGGVNYFNSDLYMIFRFKFPYVCNNTKKFIEIGNSGPNPYREDKTNSIENNTDFYCKLNQNGSPLQ